MVFRQRRQGKFIDKIRPKQQDDCRRIQPRRQPDIPILRLWLKNPLGREANSQGQENAPGQAERLLFRFHCQGGFLGFSHRLDFIRRNFDLFLLPGIEPGFYVIKDAWLFHTRKLSRKTDSKIS